MIFSRDSFRTGADSRYCAVSRAVVLNHSNGNDPIPKDIGLGTLVCGYVIIQSVGDCCLWMWGLKENTLAFLLATDILLATPLIATALETYAFFKLW